MRQPLGHADRPVGLEGGRHGLIGRPQNVAIVDGQSDQPPQCGLAFVKLRESFLSEHFRLEVRIAGDRLVFDPEARCSALVELRLRVAPGFLSTPFRLHLRVINPILQVKIPVGILNILQQVDDVLLEVGERDVVVDPRNDDSLSHTGKTAKRIRNRTGNLSELRARTGEQRMPV